MAINRPITRLATLALTLAIAASACSSDGSGAEPDPVFPPDQPAPVAELQSRLAAIVTETGVPSLGATALTSAGVLDTAAAGFRRLGDPTSVTADDRWHIGSNTKAMTAALLGRLEEAGRGVSLDTTLPEAFPHIAVIHPDYRAVTLADLLAHTGGTPGGLPDVDDEFLTLPVTQQRALASELVLADEPEVVPHTVSRYSNLGYVIVGAALETATGESWEQLMVAEIFEPLGMATCGFGAPGAVDGHDAPWGHDADEVPVNEDQVPVIGPAGTVHCSMADWSAFLMEMLKGTRGESDFLSQTTVDRLLQPSVEPVEGQDGVHTALGWLAYEGTPNGTVYVHDGSNTLWFSKAVLVPDLDRAVLGVSNHESTGIQAVEMALAALADMYPNT